MSERLRTIGDAVPLIADWESAERLTADVAEGLPDVGIGVLDSMALPEGSPPNNALAEVLVAYHLRERAHFAEIHAQLGLADGAVVIVPGLIAARVARLLGDSVALFDAPGGPSDGVKLVEPGGPHSDIASLLLHGRVDTRLSEALGFRAGLVASFVGRGLHQQVSGQVALDGGGFQWLPVSDEWENTAVPGGRLTMEGSLVFLDSLWVERGFHDPRRAIPLPPSWLIVWVEEEGKPRRGGRFGGRVLRDVLGLPQTTGD